MGGTPYRPFTSHVGIGAEYEDEADGVMLVEVIHQDCKGRALHRGAFLLGMCTSCHVSAGQVPLSSRNKLQISQASTLSQCQRRTRHRPATASLLSRQQPPYGRPQPDKVAATCGAHCNVTVSQPKAFLIRFYPVPR